MRKKHDKEIMHLLTGTLPHLAISAAVKPVLQIKDGRYKLELGQQIAAISYAFIVKDYSSNMFLKKNVV